MRILLLAWCLCIGAVPAFAQSYQTPTPAYRAAPAPLLGLGIPAALAVNGVLLDAKLLGRRRR